MNNMEPQEFEDANGRVIKAGDTLIRKAFAWSHPSGARGVEITLHRKVRWNGACMEAAIAYCSDYGLLLNAELYDSSGLRVQEFVAAIAMNRAFVSSVYEVKE